MIRYADINPAKKAFIFELDNVLYPEKDYLLQVYYLFASFIEYAETFPTAAELTDFFKISFESHGAERIFERAQEAYGLDIKYRENFERLHRTAILPLKLFLYQPILELLQQIVIDRKQLYIVTNGDPEQQLNKIRQIEWNGLEKYLVVYFANELKPKPETDIFLHILEKHNLLRRDIVIIGAGNTDREFASACGSDFIDPIQFA